MGDSLLEVHSLSLKPHLLEALLAQLGTYGGHRTLIQGRVGRVVVVARSSHGLQRPLGCSEQERRSLCLTTRSRNRSQPLQAVGAVCPVPYLLGDESLLPQTALQNCRDHSSDLDLEKVIHRPTALILHVLEDVGIAPEGHRRIGVAEHPGDRVE